MRYSVVWDDWIPELGCYALNIKEEVDRDEPRSERFSFSYEVTQSAERLYRCHRLYVPERGWRKSVPGTVRTFCRYLRENRALVRQGDSAELAQLHKCFKGIDGCRVERLREGKFSLRLKLFTRRTQEVIVYAYEGMLLATSLVAAREDIVNPEWSQRPEDGGHGIDEWIRAENRRLRVGFLDFRETPEEDTITFCERAFHEHLPQDCLRDLVVLLGHMADTYEAFLTNEDIN